MKKFWFILPMVTMLFACSLDTNDSGKDNRPTICPIGPMDVKAMEVIGESNEMSWNLLRKSLTDDGNTLLSPLSLSACLALIDNGADGDTEAQIRDFLGYNGLSQADFNAVFKMFIEGLATLDPKVKFTSANSLWHDRQLTPKKEFTTVLTEYYNAEIFDVDCAKEDVATMINSWCNEKTNGLIPRFIDQLDPSVRSVILNALYFNAAWTAEFDKRETQPMTFTKSNGETVEADFMHRFSAKEMGVDNKVMSMVSLPMGDNKGFATFFVLPKEGKTLTEAATAAQRAMGDWRTNCVPQWEDYVVNMTIPKFKLESKMKMGGMLQSMGLTLPFGAKADFSNMFEGFNGNLHDIMQSCSFRIDEHEVEAAAVTGGFIGTSVPPTMTEEKFINLELTRPFLFGVHELSTGTILFIGAMNSL